MEEKIKDRKFNVLLYPDCPEHVKALDIIRQQYDCAYCLHDKDSDPETGEQKKPHWHVVIRVGKVPIWSTALAKDLGIPDNYIQRCRRLNDSLLYLTHYNTPEKYQYSREEVKGSLSLLYGQLIEDGGKSEGEKVVELIDHIVQFEGHLSVTEFARHCATEGKWDVYRRAGAIFNAMLSEHNFHYSKKPVDEC